MKPTLIEDKILELVPFEEDGSMLMVAETSWRGMADELHGYCVYILPNPRSCRTADFIFEKKGILGLYDLKTVHGKGSVGSQLFDSF